MTCWCFSVFLGVFSSCHATQQFIKCLWEVTWACAPLSCCENEMRVRSDGEKQIRCDLETQAGNTTGDLLSLSVEWCEWPDYLSTVVCNCSRIVGIIANIVNLFIFLISNSMCCVFILNRSWSRLDVLLKLCTLKLTSYQAGSLSVNTDIN